jgi:hypothetical protein
MFVVHRFPLVGACNVIVIPESSKVLSVGIGKGGAPSVWYTLEEGEHEHFQVVVIESIPTGMPVTSERFMSFLGTVNVAGKVSHMFRWEHVPTIDKAKAEAFKDIQGEALLNAIIDLAGPPAPVE